MSANTIQSALGLLQDDPDSSQAWQELRQEVSRDHGMRTAELTKLLEAARRAHEARREYEAVARLLEIQVTAVGDAAVEAELVAEMARVLDEELLDDEKARAAYARLFALRPDDPEGDVADARERSDAKRAKWPELVERYLQEASHTADAAFRSSLLVSAAETVYRYGRGPENDNAVERIVGILREALALDGRNRRAEMLLERVLRDEGRWDELTQVLERFASEVGHKDEKVAAWVRLARVLAKKVGSRERAAAAYERVVDLVPGHAEASSFLADHFTANAMWEHLVALYEAQLVAGALRGRDEEFGATLQIAMVHWRMRGRLDAAEPWFEKARKTEPAHPGMLSFFREWCSARGETARLAAILTDAQRSLADGAERTALGAEIAKLAEEGANAPKAIEQWRLILRQDPRNREARDALKRLYRNAASWNALTDLLRQDIEQLSQEGGTARLAALREIAAVYRDHIKSDSALVAVLTQIIALDPTDLQSVRELVRVYESLQRWRDLLAMQSRQAELEPDETVKAEILRIVARRWLDQFSNVQNAVEAYEKLQAVAPTDAEAILRLKELYAKRRAYKPLFDLLGRQAEAMAPGPQRHELWMEMAKLASERLDDGSRAASLYRRVIAEDPTSISALEALEKQAERDKDFATLADALERRATVVADGASRLAVLQKLGTVYSDRVHDPAKATSVWRRVLAIAPGHAKALRVLRDGYLGVGDYDGLCELYAQSGDWEGLVEVLSGAADKAGDPELKVDLSFRCATIYFDKLQAPERAFRAFERILSVRPDDVRAAASLIPLYEGDEKWGRLPALYEILLAQAERTDEKLDLLGKLVRVTGQQLQDRAAAFSWAAKAYELAPDRAGALDEFERTARAASQWTGFVDVIAARLSSLDATAGVTGRSSKRRRRKEQEKQEGGGARSEERRVLRAKLAEVYAREMGRVDEAVQVYRALVEEDEGDDAAVQTLDKILREADRVDDLRWLFEVRIERANTALKIDLIGEWALLEEEAFGAPERAIALYRRMLQLVPHHGGALRTLARLLRAQGDAEGAAEIIAIDRDQREGADRAAREIELAKIYFDPLAKHVEALGACERALALVPNDSKAIAVVERLLAVPQTRARAAAILDRAYDQTGAARSQAEVLGVLIATSASRGDRLALYGRLADVNEFKLGDLAGAFDVVARAAGEYPSELAFWDRLAAIATKMGDAEGLAKALAAAVPAEGPSDLPEAIDLELSERIATLFDEKLSDMDRARPYLERMLARDPTNEQAFLRLKQILTTREQWLDLGALYERVVAATADSARRAELLTEVALIAEEITGDRPRAIGYYERILDISPGHEQATRALDSLYASEQRWGRLAELLARRLTSAAGEARLDLQQRLGTLLLLRLGDAAGALAYLEPVLRQRPGATDARRLVERILDTPGLRSRAALVLESVYTDRDEVADLVRILEIHLESAGTVEQQRVLLRRVAALRDERLRDDAGALEALARLLPLDPDDARARQRMLEIARRTSSYARAAAVLASTAAAADAPMPRADILMDLARLHEAQPNDLGRAEAVYRQVLALSPNDPMIALPACRELERIYALGDGGKLRDILRIEVDLEHDSRARRDLYGRLGELCESVLGDPHGAIAAWRARLGEDETDAQALAALDRLYEITASFRELVDVLRTRQRLTEDPAARRALLVRIATTLAERLVDVESAIGAYRAVVDEFGSDRRTLASLASLYETGERWRDLAETLEADLALAETWGDKLAILARLGDVRQGKLGDIPAAIAAYRQALALDPAHARCRGALEALLDDPSARREAAEILRPLYEVDGLYDRLLRVLEIEAQYTDSPSDKLGIIAQAAQVAEGPLHDPGRALSYAARGLREAVADPELPRWIERAERLAAATGRYAELADLLRSAVTDIADGELELGVTLRIADIARSRLGDAALAKQYFVRALDLRPDDRRALVALESLYEETGDFGALLDVVKRRAEASEDDSERKKLLFKQALLCDEKLGDARSAIDVYETILDLQLDAQAIEALGRLYARTERWTDLVALYERQIASKPASSEAQAALHHALGDLLEKRLGEVDRAFDEYAAALRIDPRHPRSVASLEALMAHREYAARASVMLEPVYLAQLDWRRVMATLEARLDVSQDPDERRHLLRRLSKLHEEQEENYGAALETTALLLGEDPTDESTWAELERLARVSNAQARLSGIYAGELAKVTADEPATARLAKRTGELFEAQNDVERALVFYQRAYAFEPEANRDSFDAIDRLLQKAGRPADRVRLYREALDYKNDPRERLRALHTIARVQESELGDDAGAIETYRAALDVDESDLPALDAVAALYGRGGRFRDLADLMRKRAEQSALPEDEARFRMDLAKLLVDKLGEPQAAIDELQAVVDLAPPTSPGPGAEAVEALERLLTVPSHKARVVEILRPIYQHADNWKRIVSLNRDRLSIATDDGERIAIWRESASLWETRGADLAQAFDAMRAAWTLDPEDGDAREVLDRLAAATRQWDDLAGAYEVAIGHVGGLTQRELLASLARLHDQRRDDPRRALDAWERLFALDETELEPLDQMDALATLLSDWPTLIRVLTRKADLVADDELRAATWRRIGEARRDMLDDPDGAIEAYERALAFDPNSAFTLDHLVALYEHKKSAARLVELYRRRVDLCTEDEGALKFELLVGAASRYEKDLDNRREAIECLMRANALRPDDTSVLRRLDGLYSLERMWPELLENLKSEVSLSADESARRALKKQIASLYAVELQDPQSALEAYRDVFAGGYDEDGVTAIRGIAESRDDLRFEAAAALEPVLRAAGKYTDLAAVLELRLRAQTEPDDRTHTLRALSAVFETALGDLDGAESALLRALAEAPHDASLHAEIERIAGRIGPVGFMRYAETLNERASAIFDAAVASDLFIRLGRLSEMQLDDPQRAAKALTAALDRTGDDGAVLRALDRLFVRIGDAHRLAEVLERRVSVEADTEVKAEIFFRLGKLQATDFDQKAQALATFRLALEKAPNHEASRAALAELLDDDALFEDAFEALEHVYRTLGRNEEIARIYERRVIRAKTPPERSRARLELARVLEDMVGDGARAQRAVEAAVAEDASDDVALAQLERLAEANAAWLAAADAVKVAIAAANDMSAAVRIGLWIRLAGWRRDRLGDSKGAEEAFAKALALDPENLEILGALEDLRRAPGRERDLVDTLRTRARLEGDLATKRDLLRQAKVLAEDFVGDRGLAEATLRDLVAEDESNLWALEELTKFRSAAGDDAEVVTLLLQRAELTADRAVFVALKHAAAALLLNKLGDAVRATALYEDIVEADPEDARAATALRALYGKSGRDRELSKLLLRLIDVATSQAQRTELRLELAMLETVRFQAPEDAIETLRAILEEDPTQAEAVLRLSEIYEQTGRDAELADLLKLQLEAAREREDVRAELTLLVRLGEVQERRLSDVSAAQETYERVLLRDGNHRAALEALARIAERRADWPRAAAALGRLVDLARDSSGVSWALRLAEARDKMGDAVGVENALRAGILLDPGNAGLRAMLRVRWEKSEKWAELADLLVGDAQLVAASAADTDASVRDRSAERLVAQVKLLKAAAEIHLTREHAPARAIPVLEGAARLAPQDREILLALCDAYNAAARGRDAAHVLEKIIASFGSRRTKELAVYHHRLGRALSQLGDREVALAQFDMAFKIDPGSIAVLRDLGVLAFETNDLDRAQKTFRALLLQRLDPNAGISKGEVFYYLGEISAKLGDRAKATQMFERAIENDPTLDRARSKLAELKG